MGFESRKNKKILIATGLFPPQIGGPAVYVFNLSLELEKSGCEIKIVTYADNDAKINDGRILTVKKSQNILFRYLKYFWLVLKLSRWADIVYTLDLMSAGLPATLAAKFRNKKIVFRTGGDFLWEKAFQSGWTTQPLSRYYEQKKNWQEKILLSFCRWVLKKMDLVIFSTEFQAEIYRQFYSLPRQKIKLLANAISVNQIAANQKASNGGSLIFAGRLIKLKNLERLIFAFGKIRNNDLKLLIFGDGPEKENLERIIKKINLENRVKLMGRISHEQLINEIENCRFLILPSITEISPNLALECLSLRKAIILTQETGLPDEMLKNLITIDPLSEEDIKEKMEYLLDDNNLLVYQQKLVSSAVQNRGWDRLAEEHLDIFSTILK